MPWAKIDESGTKPNGLIEYSGSVSKPTEDSNLWIPCTEVGRVEELNFVNGEAVVMTPTEYFNMWLQPAIDLEELKRIKRIALKALPSVLLTGTPEEAKTATQNYIENNITNLDTAIDVLKVLFGITAQYMVLAKDLIMILYDDYNGEGSS